MMSVSRWLFGWLEELCPSLLLLRVEREEIRNLLLQPLPLSLQAAHLLRHEQHLARELLLEVLDMH